MHKMLKARQNDGGEGEWHKEKDMSEWEREREREMQKIDFKKRLKLLPGIKRNRPQSQKWVTGAEHKMHQNNKQISKSN